MREYTRAIVNHLEPLSPQNYASKLNAKNDHNPAIIVRLHLKIHTGSTVGLLE